MSHAERRLEALGFRHDTREDAPICRWIYEDVTIDVLPIRQEVLGWNSRWFEEAIASPMTIVCGGRSIRVVSVPYFVALKLDAFEERGGRDFLASTDFEDVICLLTLLPSLSKRHDGKQLFPISVEKTMVLPFIAL